MSSLLATRRVLREQRSRPWLAGSVKRTVASSGVTAAKTTPMVQRIVAPVSVPTTVKTTSRIPRAISVLAGGDTTTAKITSTAKLVQPVLTGIVPGVKTSKAAYSEAVASSSVAPAKTMSSRIPRMKAVISSGVVPAKTTPMATIQGDVSSGVKPAKISVGVSRSIQTAVSRGDTTTVKTTPRVCPSHTASSRRSPEVDLTDVFARLSLETKSKLPLREPKAFLRKRSVEKMVDPTEDGDLSKKVEASRRRLARVWARDVWRREVKLPVEHVASLFEVAEEAAVGSGGEAGVASRKRVTFTLGPYPTYRYPVDESHHAYVSYECFCGHDICRERKSKRCLVDQEDSEFMGLSYRFAQWLKDQMDTATGHDYLGSEYLVGEYLVERDPETETLRETLVRGERSQVWPDRRWPLELALQWNAFRDEQKDARMLARKEAEEAALANEALAEAGCF
jgi:hypothetical protein